MTLLPILFDILLFLLMYIVKCNLYAQVIRQWISIVITLMDSLSFILLSHLVDSIMVAKICDPICENLT